jgi:hypothetical protein
LRMLLCPGAVKDRVRECLGHGTKGGCAKCKSGTRLVRDLAHAVANALRL